MDSVGCAGVSVCDNNFFKETMNLRSEGNMTGDGERWK